MIKCILFGCTFLLYITLPVKWNITPLQGLNILVRLHYPASRDAGIFRPFRACVSGFAGSYLFRQLKYFAI